MLLVRFVFAMAVLTAVQAPIRIRVVDYPRPVSEAVRQVEQHFSFVVTYEDVSYVHPADIVDITASVRRDGDLSKKVWGMRNGTIDVLVEPAGKSRQGDVQAALTRVLEASRTTGNAGDFTVQCERVRCDVIPVAIRGLSGERETYVPLLDTRITMTPAALNGLQFLQQFTDAVAAASGRKLFVGTAPINLMAQRQVRVEATKGLAARDVLRQALRTIDRPLSWQLLCGAGQGASCALNIHIVNLQ